MKKEEILKAITKLPKTKSNDAIGTMFGISVDDLLSAVDRLNKTPTYDRLLRENKKQKEIIDKIKSAIKTNCIKNGNKYEEICCSGDYLLSILENREETDINVGEV